MSGRRPLIGISCNGKGKDPKRYTLPCEYVAAVRRAGAIPVVLPPGDETPTDLLDRLDAVILSGGGDLYPDLYGQSAHRECYGLDRERDAYEVALAREVVRRGVPALAICRGMQVLNVAFGGTLVQHLPDVRSGVSHRSGPGESARHAVRIDGESRLASVFEATDLPSISSCHHQAADRLGDGLRAVAWASDGTIEALEIERHPALLAVQWHPEETAAEDLMQQRLFGWLAAIARVTPTT